MNNVTLTAIMVALLAATQCVSFLLRDWQNRLYQAFAFLCATAFLSNAGMVLATIHEARGWHVMHLLGALATGPAAVYFFLRLLGKPQPRGAAFRPLLFPVGAALALLTIVGYDPAGDALAPPPAALKTPLAGNSDWRDLTPQIPSSPEALSRADLVADRLASALFRHPATHVTYLLVGLYVFACYLAILLNILDRFGHTRSRVERARLKLMLWLGLIAVLGNLAQSTRPYLELPVSDYPIGGLGQLGLIAFLSQVILAYRLLDLQEIVSKGLIFLAQALIIGAMYSILLALFGDQKSMLNLAITVFLASGVVSLLHDPLRKLFERSIWSTFFNRRYQLTARLTMLDRDLPRILSAKHLFEAMMNGLTEVPRITHAAVFLWEERTKDYACVHHAGPADWPPPVTVSAASPFAQELLLRKEPFGYEDLVLELEGSEVRRVEVTAALATLRKLDSEVAIPFTGDGLLFGFLVLKDDSMHEGFTHDELALLQQLADKASVIIQNSDAIQRMKERDRLAALGQMAAGLAHEIRNPLGAIRGAAQYLADDIPAPEDREFLDIIMEEVDRLNKVVTEFLDYSRPLKTRLNPADLNTLISQAVQLLRAQGLPEGIEVKLDLADNLPPAPVDLEKIKQVLLNLLQNALQAMPEGGILTVQTRSAPRIPWAGARQGAATLDRVEIRVMDTGQGISPENLEKLFIPFFTTKAGGTGLGLAISQRLVQAHEGELEVHSTPGQGTRFTIRLPLLEPVALLEPPGKAEVEGPGTSRAPQLSSGLAFPADTRRIGEG